MKNILIIDNSPDLTGAFKSILQVTNVLATKFDFTYIIPKKSNVIEHLKKSSTNVLEFEFIEISKSFKLLLYIPQLIFNTFKLLRYIRTHNVNIIHVNDIYNMLGITVKILNPKIKLVYHIRLLPNSYARKLYITWKKLIEKYADDIICVSEIVASNFDSRKVIVIHDSLKTTKNFSPSNHSSGNSKLRILYLANYISGKGHKQAIDAYINSLSKISNTELVFFGGTLNKKRNLNFKKYLINYCKESGINENIYFNGISIPEFEIQKADIMLNFSESESFSMTTLEALAYGTPIIVTACGGPSEIIIHEKSGILVEVNDIKGMSEAIVNLVNDKSLRAHLSKNGQERFKNKFNLMNQIIKIENVYAGYLHKK